MERYIVECDSEPYAFYNEFGPDDFENWDEEDAELMLDLQTAPVGYSVSVGGGGGAAVYTYTRVA